MLRNIVGVLFFVASGFFVYMMNLVAFMRVSDAAGASLTMLGILCVPLLVFHLFGLGFYRGASWKIATAYTLLVPVAFTVFLVIWRFSLALSPEMLSIMDARGLEAFSEYRSGFALLAFFTVLGLVLYKQGARAERAKETVRGEAVS